MKLHKVGLIGCGPRQHGHMAAFREMSEVEVVACADFKEELRTKFAETYNIPNIYASAEDMLVAEDLDIVTVVAWPKYETRVVPVIQAAEAGVKGIICEKPFSVDIEEADVMLEACRKHCSKLVINHQYRFFEPVARIKQAINSGEIGDVEFYRTTCHVKIHGQGTHMIDLVRYLHSDKPFAWTMGSVNGIKTLDANLPGPDEDAAVITFEDGVRIYLECGGQTPRLPDVPPTQNLYLNAIGTRGCAWFGLSRGYRIWTSEGEYIEEPCDYGVEDKKAQIALVRELIESMETGKQHRSSAELGRSTQEALVAVIQSAVERRRVNFPIQVPPKYLSKVKKTLIKGI